MKAKYILLFLTLILVTSCGVDRRKEYESQTGPNRWIESEMRNIYLWNYDIPERSKLNFFDSSEEFFTKLLSSQDGKNKQPYSYIEVIPQETTRTNSTASVTYGLEYTYSANPSVSGEYFVRILYVYKDSPAEEAGLQRGDWIFKINNEGITEETLSSLLKGEQISLEVGNIDEQKAPIDTRTVNVSPARSITNNPIYFYDTYPVGDKRVGYVVYNSFVSGEGENDTRYLTELAAISNEFRAQNIVDIIVDFRYNRGGELDRPVPLWCSILAKPAAMGQVMGHITFNDQNADKNETLYFSEENLFGGSNLNLSRVFVITGEYTASASEAVISFLTPYTDIITIGTKTVGKDVGSIRIENAEHSRITLYPIVCQLYNASPVPTEYRDGFPPKYPVDENGNTDRLLPLGDPEEMLLSEALSIIESSYNPGATDGARSAGMLKVAGSSLDRKPALTVINQ